MPRSRPLVALVILDGWGCAPPGPGNAVELAGTPNFDRLWRTFPHTTLAASGEAVGLPPGQMGNSEVGHLTIGSVIAANFYVLMLIWPLRMVGMLLGQIPRAVSAGGRIHEVLSTDAAVAERPGARGLPEGPVIARTLRAIETRWVEAGFPSGEAFERIVAEGARMSVSIAAVGETLARASRTDPKHWKTRLKRLISKISRTTGWSAATTIEPPCSRICLAASIRTRNPTLLM